MSFVLDNSVTMRWLFLDGKPQQIEYADKVLAMIKQSKAIVPATWGLEVANVIARAEATSKISEAQSETFLEILNAMNIELDHETFTYAFSDTLRLSRRYRLSSYDASYLELALRLNLPLATLYEDLQKAAAKAGVEKFV